jgi:hypothetical protein
MSPQAEAELGADEPEEVDPLENLMDAAPAAAPVYANTSGRLFEVDPETGAVEVVGDFHMGTDRVENVVDIAIDLQGRMVAGTFTDLYLVDPNTAEVVHLCTSPVEMTALAFTHDGRLVAGGDADVAWLDVADCRAERLVVGSDYLTSGDLVGLPDGYLYWTVEGEDSDELVRIDPADGSTAWVGPIAAESLYGLGYDDNQLYGFSANGDIVRISPVGASSQVITTVQDRVWWGATTNPVVW